jgi:uncharacterized membrane protein
MIQDPTTDVFGEVHKAGIAMSINALAYIVVTIVFVALDGAWLSIMGPMLYKPALGDMLADKVRLAPAIAFYLLYPIGIEIFALVPALRAGSVGHAALYGALFGLFAYATYDLTNAATLRQWTTQITLTDMAWGAVATGLCATIAVLACRAVMTRFDLSF